MKRFLAFVSCIALAIVILGLAAISACTTLTLDATQRLTTAYGAIAATRSASAFLLASGRISKADAERTLSDTDLTRLALDMDAGMRGVVLPTAGDDAARKALVDAISKAQ